MTAASEPVDAGAGQPVLLRIVELGPPPEPADDDIDGGWRSSLLDRLPVLKPARPTRTDSLATEPPPQRQNPVTITEPQAQTLAATVARFVLEVLDGRRPARQLNAVLDVQACSTVRVLLAGGLREPVSRPSIRTVRVCVPCEQSIESCVIFRCGHRYRALALRLEHRNQRWIGTALRVG